MRSFELEQAGREDIEAFIADQLARWKPATATNRCRSLRVFYGSRRPRRDPRLASASRLLRYLGG
jgi:hypothetical protein